ncbi:hypothetical protein ACLOJK_022548, partial [Asimina triloba]
MEELVEMNLEEELWLGEVKEVVLGEVEVEVRVKVVDPSQWPRSRYQKGVVEVEFE